jgi:multidrug efflux pump subunit AcrA (membrane-fusion protein)
VSETVSPRRGDGQRGDAPATEATGQVPGAGLGPAAARGSRGRVRWVALAIVVVVAAGVVSAWRAGVFSPAASSSPGGSSAVGTAPVVRTTLATTVQDGGSIGYSGSRTITAPAPGTSSQATTDQQAVTTDQQTITTDQQTTSEAQQTLSNDEQAGSDTTGTDDQTVAADEANVSTDQSALTTEQAKQAHDCAVTSSAATGPDTTACTTDEQQVSTDQATLTTARQKLAADRLAGRTAGDEAQAKVASDQVALQGDQAKLASDQAKLASDQATLASLQATAANPGTIYTWLPQVGDVIRQDQRVYSVSGEPVPLLYGAIPAYRAFYAGMSDGGDVGELTHDLIELGYGDGLAQSDHYSQATAAAVRRWQEARGLPATGEILLGEVVFEPGPIRVTTVTPSSGAPVSSTGSGTVLTATGLTPVVTVDLDVTQEYLVKPGDAVSVVLPDGTTTVGGQVESVGTVATCPGGSTTGTGSADQSPCSTTGSGTNTTPEVTVTITLDATPPQATLDQAPVNVNITEYRAANVLAVPVGALLAQQSGAYAVEVVGAGNTRRLVPVTVGLLDDASGLVQVTGNLTPGEQVVEAGS